MLVIESGASLQIGSQARLSAASVQVAGTLRLASSVELSVLKDILVVSGGLVEQPGGENASISFQQPGGVFNVEGILSLDGPLQITGTEGSGQLLVSRGGLVKINQNAALGVTGSLINNGAMQQTQPVDLSKISRFLYITGYADGSGDLRYAGVDIFPEEIMGLTTVTVWGNQYCVSPYWDRNTVRRCYQITPSLPASSIISFYFRQAEANYQKVPFPFRETETDWVVLNGAFVSGSGEAVYAKATKVTGYGRFALHDPEAPPIQWCYFPGVLR